MNSRSARNEISRTAASRRTRPTPRRARTAPCRPTPRAARADLRVAAPCCSGVSSRSERANAATRGEEQHAEQDHEQQADLLRHAELAQRSHQSRAPQRDHRGARALEEKRACLRRHRAASARRRSPSTGSAPAPLRPWASRAARCRSTPGSAARSGNCSARWYRPALNGCGSPLLLRVPSGKITSESPLRSASTSGSSGSSSSVRYAAHVHRVEHLARQPVLERARASSSRARRSAASRRAARAAARPRSAPSRSGSGGWRSRCAARPSAGCLSSGLARR